jgi:hypothetical protein
LVSVGTYCPPSRRCFYPVGRPSSVNEERAVERWLLASDYPTNPFARGPSGCLIFRLPTSPSSPAPNTRNRNGSSPNRTKTASASPIPVARLTEVFRQAAGYVTIDQPSAGITVRRNAFNSDSARLEWLRSTGANACFGARAGGGMTVKAYVLRRLSQGETDLKVLARQTRIQFPSRSISFSYIRSIRNEWQKASASRRDEGEKPSGSGSTHL